MWRPGRPPTSDEVFGGEDVSPSEYYVRKMRRFETGSEKYAWLRVVCVAPVGRRRGR